MKKSILLFVLAMTTMVAAHAQGPRIGIRAGVNYSGFGGSDADNLDRIWGGHGGLTANFPLSTDNFFSVQPELLFSMKGAETSNDQTKFKVNYLDVPVLGRVNAGPLYFEAGPQLSVRISGDVEQNGVNVIDDLDAFKRTSLGYAAGIGLAATPLGLNIGVRYNGDISKLYDDENAPNYRNDVFMLTLGYLFGGAR
ncbi:PorT family protein [Pontibacter sp. JH31]|uniref:PorT family protein n=1 Tax=Pontibacter aquaedesilientis TaxID=2766980 RepID=A0ABR7XJP1_9BACT|nr:porin family protein [Pontibacter aquaedesilientis]MBD1398527.1 PorT family protein [Pontibacter aquaedesilientis]